MDTPGGVVVGIDGSDLSWAAFDWAYREASRRRTGLHAVHVTGVGHPLRRWFGAAGDARAEDDAVLADVDRHLPVPPDPAVAVERSAVPAESALAGPASDLVGAARTAALLVLGAAGTSGLREQLLGATALRCAVSAACPTVLVRDLPHHVREVLVGIDDSAAGRAALLWAFREADLHRARLRVVHVVWPWQWPGHSEDETAAAARRMMRFTVEQLPPTPSGRGLTAVVEVVRRSDPVRTLVERAAHADLLVCGSVGRASGEVSSSIVRSAAGLGSVAGHAVHRASSHVVVVPAAPEPAYPWDREERLDEERDWDSSTGGPQWDDTTHLVLP
ncbi:universal stress protein [Streptomyces sp. NPDC001380]|uniref:universal stress protein n=1 Tax=Streptomyces sp. NPDC001380 TaxID=3364566 RepID=UPI0036749C7C